MNGNLIEIAATNIAAHIPASGFESLEVSETGPGTVRIRKVREDFLTAAQVGKILQLTETRVRKMARDGILTYLRTGHGGGDYRFERSQLYRDLERLTRGAYAPPIKVGG